ncbi:MAG TPA: prepilin-type N-terminal cleavage/methylation domain-containing protein [Phycisphaerae bacterium]|nr:prepilin-type N-terminal cleavage/methylation domain-containing protein [Phycisphaerae bacterium]
MAGNVKIGLNMFRRGMTMIELLVAVSVLAILIMIFGRILSQSQRVVTGSQKIMKFNASGTAAATILRKDIGQTTSAGFIYIINNYITVDGNTWPRATMYMGVTGNFTSWNSSSTTSSEAIITLGLCNQNGLTSNSLPKMLWRNCTLLTSNSSDPSSITSSSQDTLKYSLADTENVGSTSLTKRAFLLSNAWLGSSGLPGNSNWSPAASTDGLTLPPSTIDDVNMIWKYLISNVNKLSIMWTKGDYTTTNPKKLIWYGMDINGALHLPNGSGPGGITTVSYASNYDNPVSDRKYNSNVSGFLSQTEDSVYPLSATTNLAKFELHSGNNYCVLWNSELPNTYWPTALKITYEVTDGKSDNPTTKTYEIICPTGI